MGESVLVPVKCGGLLCSLLIILKFSGIGALTIGITHWNDVDGQIESFQRVDNGTLLPCSTKLETDLQCVGGLRSLAHWLNDSSVYGKDVLPENILRLSSGNMVGGGSGWISSIEGGWSKYADLVKQHFRPHVTTLGIKEFEAGLQSTLDFINNLGPAVVTLANTCYQNQSKQYGKDEVEFCDNYNIHEKIRVLTILDTAKSMQFKIGVIGFVDPNVERLSLTGKLKFAPIVPSVQEVVSRHQNDISTFIAIGDGSNDVAKEILDTIPQVKLVIYGSNGDDQHKSSQTYPTEYKHGYIATAGRYGRSVGNLLFELDTDTGNLHPVPGQSKLIETGRPEKWNAAAQAAQTDYTKLEAQIRKAKGDIVGQSRVHLQGGDVCWRQECNLGNLVTDAMVHCALNHPTKPFDFRVHAIWHARALFEDEVKAGTKISRFDIHKWLPYHNQAHLVRVKGSDLRRVFEASGKVVAENAKTPDWGQFLQVSNGLEVYYDSKQVRVRMTQDANGVPQLRDMTENENYYLVIPTFLYEGRGLYQFAGETGFWKDVIFDNVSKSNFAYDDECVEEYIRALGQVSVGFEKRIWVDGDPNDRPEGGSSGHTLITVTLTVLVFTMLQAVTFTGYLFFIPLLRRCISPESAEYSRNEI